MGSVRFLAVPSYTSVEFAPTTTTATFDPLTTDLQFHDVRADTMTDSLELTAGDTNVPVRAQLFDPNGDPEDLEDARVTFRMTDRSGESVIDTRADVEDPEDNDGEQGWVRHEWRRGQTDDSGLYKIRFIVRYPDRSIMHYPNSRPAKLLIRDE